MSRLDQDVDLGSPRTPETTAATPGHSRSARSLGLGLLTYAVLALSPVGAFFVLRVRPVYAFDMVDPFIYTGYSQNATDLMTRFGPGVYYWVRLGAIIPEHLSFLAFGPVAGFFVLRYLLILMVIVPLFLLVRRLHSALAGWLAVALFLTNPVMYSALGSDYPDSVIFAYLAVAYSLLFIPARTTTGRLAAAALAGVFLGACVHSQVVSLPLVGALALGYAVALARGKHWKALVLGALSVAGGAVLVTGGFVAVAKLWLGHGDLLNPTLVNFRKLQEPSQLLLWHSTNSAWAERVPYLAVPVVVVLAWLVLATKDRWSRQSSAELGAGVWLTVTVLAAFYLQFRGTVGILEYHLYSSSIWVPVLVLLAFVLLRAVGSPVERRPTEAEKLRSGRILAVILAVVAGAAVASAVTVGEELSVLRVTAGVSFALVLLVAVAAVVRIGWVRALTASLFALGVLGLTVAPAVKPVGPNLSEIPIGHYDRVLGHASSREDYAALVAASQLPQIVGRASRPGAVPRFWASTSVPNLIANQMSATYIWNNIPTGLPEGGSSDKFATTVREMRPDPLVIVASTAQEAQDMLGVLADRGAVEAVRRATVDADGLPLQVWAVTVR